MMKICYVILHYQNMEVTNECILHLDRIKGENSVIIVVDNGSLNKSGEKIKKNFEFRSDVIVIVNDKNLGFAKGNNIGYNFAKKQLMGDIIIVMNSDIFINDSQFEQKLETVIRQKSVHIIAPDIITSDKIHQNPHRLKRLGNLKILKRLFSYTVILLLVRIEAIRDIILDKMNNRSSKKVNKKYYESMIDGIVPHGACVIYTKSYIDNEDIAFVPKTFLFSEEDLLYDYAQKKKYDILYYPNISVMHLEDASINYDRNSSFEKFLFNLKNRRNSLIMILINRCFRYNK